MLTNTLDIGIFDYINLQLKILLLSKLSSLELYFLISPQWENNDFCQQMIVCLIQHIQLNLKSVLRYTKVSEWYFWGEIRVLYHLMSWCMPTINLWHKNSRSNYHFQFRNWSILCCEHIWLDAKTLLQREKQYQILLFHCFEDEL